MRKFRARDWVGAAADFRAAIEASPDHVKAHYNLACLAAITGDRETALAQLRWLAASDLAEAGQRIAKARTDPDMSFIRDDPEVQDILRRDDGLANR
jgi:thioredoxin-like negative regulator of GroEL